MSDPSKSLAIFAPGMGAGGAERSMLKLAGGIAARGYAVDLVLARAEGPLLAEVPASVRLVDLRARRVLTSLPALVHYLRREQPVALLSVLHGNIIALSARQMAGVRTRVIVSERNTLSSESQHYATDLRMRLMPRLVRYFYPWADAIVAVSKGVADDLTQVVGIPRELVWVIYNPIVTPGLVEKALAPLEHPWFEPGEPPVILAVGRLSAQKDFATLILALARIRQVRPARLLILGEGEGRPALESLVGRLDLEQDVSLPGFIPNPYPYMRRASLFVLSSRWEGLPGVLIEALFCGVPVISTDCPSGPREILADGKYGRLVPVGNVDTLVRAILTALAEKWPHPPPESWRPFELDVVVDQYLDMLFGNGSCLP
jgi:glycosyltransferase involved in cell wall biosynthesis